MVTTTTPPTKDILFFKIVQIATVAVFLGRAWQHWRWDAPFRTLLWDENWMSGLVQTFLGMDWASYSSSPVVDATIQNGIQLMGVYYFLAAIAALFIRKFPAFLKWIVIVGGVCLVLLAGLYCKEKFFNLGQFFEYSLQFGSPFLLVYLLKQPIVSDRLFLLIKFGIALTFTCHGLYAVNFYPRPGLFTEMTMNILQVNDQMAIRFLNTAGIMDFIISIGIFLPRQLGKYSLLYAVLWGLATTLARVWAHFDVEWLDYVLVQWLHESVMRFPHFLIPLGVLLLSRKP